MVAYRGGDRSRINETGSPCPVQHFQGEQQQDGAVTAETGSCTAGCKKGVYRLYPPGQRTALHRICIFCGRFAKPLPTLRPAHAHYARSKAGKNPVAPTLDGPQLSHMTARGTRLCECHCVRLALIVEKSVHNIIITLWIIFLRPAWLFPPYAKWKRIRRQNWHVIHRN